MSAITDLEPALTDIATAVQAQQGDIGTLQTAVAGKQASDADLTAIAALAPSDDALIQRKAGAWTSRTPAQVKADMSIGVGDVSGLDENTRDVIGTALVAGSGVAVTVDDPGNTITIAVSGVVADAINDGTTTVAPSQNAVYDALAMKAPIASPVFTGTPAAPTAAAGTSTTQIATTAFVRAAARPTGARWRTGQYYFGGRGEIGATQVLSGNYVVARLRLVPDDVSIDRIGIIPGGTNASYACRVGLYLPDDTNGNPGTQIITHSGTLLGTTLGIKEATVSQALTAGFVWDVVQVAAGGFSNVGLADTNSWHLALNTGTPTGSPYSHMYSARTDAALPSSLAGTSWTLNTGAAPGMIVRKA